MSRIDPSPTARLSLADDVRLDQRCLEFEDAWIRGERPAIEDYLDDAGVDPDRRDAWLYELLQVEVAHRSRLGDLPTADDYRDRFPLAGGVVDRVLERPVGGLPPAKYEAGDRVGRYEIELLVGAGGFGDVYQAWDEPLNRRVALKSPSGQRVATTAALDRLLTEARLAAGIRHPGIAQVFDVDCDDAGRPFVVYEFIDGETLAERLRSGTLDHRTAARWMRDVARAAHAAHRQGVTHRDLHPANVLIDEDDQPRILDFGLAVEEPVQEQNAGEIAGSIRYMSPEQCRGDSHWIDGRADVWAIGVMLYEALTGRLPFRSPDPLAEILERDPRPPRQIDDGIPRELEAICLRCLHKQTDARFATCDELADELQTWLDDPRPRRRAFAAAVASTLFLLALLLAGIAASPRFQHAPAALDGQIKMLVYRGETWVRAGSRQARSVRIGDRVRLEIEANQPAYLYVVWLDGSGAAVPLHPWAAADWATPHERKERALSLPSRDPTESWPLGDQTRIAECLVLLGRRQPLPDDLDVPALFAVDGETEPPSVVTRFRNGRIAFDGPQERGIDHATRLRVDNETMRRQRSLYQNLAPHFDLVYTITAPVQ
ncbi:MAG: protein kinase [Pirellulaceae bacterium]|jgi:predicted Ser/Thr protein kinase|nr:protein kinase [Pirellulaceae bacterium]MDP7017126.1 protein kinase [Pirellulaceae bacterium]